MGQNAKTVVTYLHLSTHIICIFMPTARDNGKSGNNPTNIYYII